ncbi:MAG: Rpn family recombination-promoting nuclease/putative transposase [Firmicutes bacterium]|nr:Rpn family recombination-promoting nuclease/putative transposase [Bacillota bacterium]
MIKKTLEELTIADDFMLGAVMSDPQSCKPLIEYILNVKINKIEYPELQKEIDKNYRSKSVRLDVYVEDDKNTVYDIEIQTTNKRNLAKRMRYYQGMIDLNIIDKGEDYSSLKKSFVIFICTYDPFGKDSYIYTFKNRCDEENSLVLNDGAVKMVLNAKGTKGNISEELRHILDYIAGGIPKGEYAKGLDAAVEDIKKSKKWGLEYMTLLMRDKENEKLGKYAGKISALKKIRNVVGNETLIEIFDGKKEVLDRVIFYIDTHPDWDDEEIADAVINDEE